MVKAFRFCSGSPVPCIKVTECLEETAQSALEQIRQRKYREELKTKGIKEEQIKEYGFAFEGKTVLIVD